MSKSRLALKASGVALAAAGLLVPLSLPASADFASQCVFLVKDQAGGAYYNLTTGERFDVIVASAVPTIGVFAVEAADGFVMSADGALFGPIDRQTQGSPGDAVVQVVQTNVGGAYQDASTGAEYALVTAGATIPAENDYALMTATNTLLLVNGDVLLPIQKATGTSNY
jgi:hypothetical protein